MFFRRSKMQHFSGSRQSGSHAKPRGQRTTRFESLETRQMFDGASIVPMEVASLNAPPHVMEALLVGGSSGNEIKQLIAAPGGAGSNHDSVWIDFDLPVKYWAAGRSFKPLFAFYVKDLDNRVNLNVQNVHKAVETLFAGPVRVAAGDVNGDGRADMLAVWNPLDINPRSTPPGVWSLNHHGGAKPVDPWDPNANGPEPFRPPFMDGPHVTPSGPARPGSPFGPNGPNGPEPYRLWEVGPDGELRPWSPPAPPPDAVSWPIGPIPEVSGPNGLNGPEPYRLWEIGPDGELYPLGEGPTGSRSVGDAPSAPSGPQSGPFGPNGPNGPEPYRLHEFHSPARICALGCARRVFWDWLELKPGATTNGYNKDTTTAGSLQVIRLVNVQDLGAALNGKYFVAVYDTSGNLIFHDEVDFKGGNATVSNGWSVKNDLFIGKVGVSIPR
jgi:hypothetical protein